MPITDLEIQIADKLALAGPADLVFFGGKGVISRIIALGTTTPPQWWRGEFISHVGMLFNRDRELLLGESTTLADEPCVITGKHVKGVQAHHAVPRIARYDGKVWLARMDADWRENRFTFAADHALSNFCLKSMGEPYDNDDVALAGGCILRWFLPENTKKVFCSEWNAKALKLLGLLPVNIPAGAYNPAGLARCVVHEGTHRALERVK